MGDKKRVGVLGGGRKNKTEETEGYIELREGMRRGGGGGGEDGEDKRKSGRKKSA